MAMRVSFREFLHLAEAFGIDKQITNAHEALDYLSEKSGTDLSQFKDQTISAQEFDGIVKIYRNLSKRFHPDKNPGNDQAEAIFKSVLEAYNLLQHLVKSGQPFSAGSFGGGSGSTGSRMDVNTLAELLAVNLQQSHEDRRVVYDSVTQAGAEVQAAISRQDNPHLFGNMPHNDNFYNISFMLRFRILDEEAYSVTVKMINTVNPVYGQPKVLNSVEERGDISGGFFGGQSFSEVDELVLTVIRDIVTGVQTGVSGMKDATAEYFQKLGFQVKGSQGDKNNFAIILLVDQNIVRAMLREGSWHDLMGEAIQEAGRNLSNQTRDQRADDQILSLVKDIKRNNPYIMTTPVEIHIEVRDKNLSIYGKHCRYRRRLTLGGDHYGRSRIDDELSVVKLHIQHVVGVEAVFETAKKTGSLQRIAQEVIRVGREQGLGSFEDVEITGR